MAVSGVTELNSPAAARAGTLRGRDIICFSHDWGWHVLSRNHLIRLRARDNRILWVNSLGHRSPTVSRADIGRALMKAASWAVPLR